MPYPPEVKLSLAAFRIILDEAAVEAGLPDDQRAKLQQLGPGRYALGLFARHGAACPIVSAFGYPVGGFLGKENEREPLFEAACQIDRRIRGNYVTVVA